jgi:methylenetetrahydrofolate dehydrogenase (NADP+)/methenyltetrahydrofolate cyclohydrolase
MIEEVTKNKPESLVSADNSGQFFDGRLFAAQKLTELKRLVDEWQRQHKLGLTIVSIYPHEDEASVLYTKLKKQDALQAGINYKTVPLSLGDSRHVWLKAVMKANRDPKVQAILVQKPSRQAYEKYGLKHRIVSDEVRNGARSAKSLEFSTWWQNIAESISTAKDIDGLAPLTLFKLERMAEIVELKQRVRLGDLSEYLLPATAQAVVDIALFSQGNDLEKLRTKKIGVIGQSVIVGRPAVAGFQALGINTLQLTRKHDLSQELPECDVVVSATGKSDFIPAKWVKPGSVLIDVGAPKPEFQADCYSKAAFYTPVPFGVGPVTRACLLENLFKLPETYSP